MPYRFQKHYTREEARNLLPQIRLWLESLEQLRVELETNERKLAGLMTSGQDMGGMLVNKSVKVLAELQDCLRKFAEREIIIKDIERGLIDFPALMGDKEVFLCWEKDEDDIEYWHDIDTGYAGREPL